ncbi:MAG: formylglycine-generating enzyme family protein [Planctomycetota bacterium]
MRIPGGVVVLSALLLAPLAAQREEVSFLPEHPVRWGDAGPAHGARARAAVIVTADRYGNTAFDAPSAKPSGEALRQALVEHAGFSRASIVELSGDQVHSAAVQATLERVAASIGDGKTIRQGTLLLLWVGHGFTQGGDQQLFGYFTQQVANGFAPVVTQRQLAAWLDAAYTAARERGVELATALVVDACRPNVGAPPKDAVAVRAKAWQVFSATSGKFALAPSAGGAFVFSQAFADAVDMRAKQAGTADLGDVFRQAKELTERRTAGAQVPELVLPGDAALAKTPPAVVVPRRIAFTVRLVDALTGGRVERGAVRLDDTKHDATEGRLALAAAPGNHQVEVHAEGYLTRAMSLELGDEQADGELTVPLLPHVTVVRVRVSPPRVVEVRVASDAARPNYHVMSGVTDVKGGVELRLPGGGPTLGLQVLRAGRELQTATVDGKAAAWLRDASGQHTGIPLVEVPVALGRAVLDQIGDDVGAGITDASAPGERPQVRGLDAGEWQAAQQNIARERWDLARVNLANIEGGGAVVIAWRRYVDAHWARALLEKALADGRRRGDFGAADEVIAWWQASGRDPSVENKNELARLLAELERERVPLAVRQGFEAGNQAYAAGELEKALAAYKAVRAQANASYGQRIDEQVEDIEARLYARHLLAGNQHEVDGDLEAARASYRAALLYSDRAQRYLARLEAPAARATGTSASPSVGASRPASVQPRTPLPASARRYLPQGYDLVLDVDLDQLRALHLDGLADMLADREPSAKRWWSIVLRECGRAVVGGRLGQRVEALAAFQAADAPRVQRELDEVDVRKDFAPNVFAQNGFVLVATAPQPRDEMARPSPDVVDLADPAPPGLALFSMALGDASGGAVRAVRAEAVMESDQVRIHGRLSLGTLDSETRALVGEALLDPAVLKTRFLDGMFLLPPIRKLLEGVLPRLVLRRESAGVSFEATVAVDALARAFGADYEASVGPDRTPPSAAPESGGFDLGSSPPADAEGARIETGIGLSMIRIEAQEFVMGSPEDEQWRRSNEVRHRVKITKPYWIGETEVTQKQWREVMGTTPWKGRDSTIEGDAVAATYVSWTDAMELCRKLTERERTAGRLPDGYCFILPTEAEWELACRAGSSSAYCFGDDEGRLREYAVYYEARSGEYAHAVKQRKANVWGLYDMHGNVWEWCLDEAAYSFGVKTSTYRDGVVDPCNTNGPQRVGRGGGWGFSARLCRSANRLAGEPGDAGSDLGFRPVLAARSDVK